MKDGQPIKTTISVLFKTSSRANAKLRMKTFRNKNVDDILDPEKRLSGIPAKAEIVKVAMGKQSVQDFKDIIDPPKEVSKTTKAKKNSPTEKSAIGSTKKVTKTTRVKKVAKPKNSADSPIVATKVVEMEVGDAKAKLKVLLGL